MVGEAEDIFMNIQVCSRKDARNFKCNVPWAAISITSSPHVWPDLSEEGRIAILQLYFLDHTTPGENSMTKEQAQVILQFMQSVQDQIECLMVHCDAGLSRSPAVAAAIAKIFIGEDEDKPYFQRYYPNYLVYKLILEAHFGDIVTL
jgi:predicted protein tyrosine phosphatase